MRDELRDCRDLTANSPNGTTRLGDLHRAAVVEARRPDAGIDALRDRLDEQEHVFRVLFPWIGPWASLHGQRRSARWAAEECLVVASPRYGRRPDRFEAVADVLRGSVRWLGWTVDAGSPVALSRWMEILGEADVAWPILQIATSRPERHSSSESSSWNAKPALSAAA